MGRLQILVVGVLAACSSTPPVQPEPAPAPIPSSADSVQTAPPPAATQAAAVSPGRAPAPVQSRLLGRTIRPQAPRPLNLKTECRFENETGYNGTASVEVVNSQVKRLSALFNVPGQGQCLFDMAQMRQTRTQPVELRDTRSGCTARLWEQGDKATISFSDCARHCSNPAAFQYVWPVLVERKTGICL